MVNNLKLQFAFFWVGQDILIPQALVDSIRYVYGNEAYIYHFLALTMTHTSYRTH